MSSVWTILPLMLKDQKSPSRFLSSRQPKVVMVTKTEQMPSRRRANQREVVRNRNQDSVQDEKKCSWNWRAHKDERWMWKGLRLRPECKSWWASNIFWNLCSAPKARIVHRPWRDEDRWEKTGLRAAGRSTHYVHDTDTEEPWYTHCWTVWHSLVDSRRLISLEVCRK